MTLIKNKLDNKTNYWSRYARPRVGTVCLYQSKQWVNSTGRNGEPGKSNDWVNSGSLEDIQNNTYSNGLTLEKDNVTLGGKLTQDTYLSLESSGEPLNPRRFVVGETHGKRLEVSEKSISLNSDFIGLKTTGDTNIKAKRFNVFGDNEITPALSIIPDAVIIDARKRKLYISTSNGSNKEGHVLTKLNDSGEVGWQPAALNPFSSIDGYLVNKRANKDYSKIEVGDQIQGNYTDKRYIIADVIGLPYTDENNLEFYIDNEK